MTSFEENIPAFSMWKIFYDTMKLLELDHSENKIEHLANIVNSQKLTSIFIYNPAISLTFEQHNAIAQRYKAFTVWLLGKFFYLSSSNNLLRIHKLVTDVQLRILYMISTMQPHIYHELTKEYCNIFKLLNTYKGSEALELNIFKVQEFKDLQEKMELNCLNIKVNTYQTCIRLKKIILIFMKHIMVENLKSYYVNDTVNEDFNNIIYVLKEDTLDLKLDVLEICKTIFESSIIFIDKLPLLLREKFDLIIELLEQLIYDVYNEKVKVDDQFVNKIEGILIIVLDNKNFSCNNFKLRISKFIFNRSYSMNSLDIKVSEKIQIKCYQILLQEEVDLESTIKFNFVTQLISRNKALSFEVICTQILNDLNQFNKYKTESVCIVENISVAWRDIYKMVKNELQKFYCNNNCIMEETLTFLDNVIDMLLKIKLQTNRSVDNKIFNIEFFSEGEFIVLLLSFINNHIAKCKADFSHDPFIRILLKIPVLSSTLNIEIIFHIIAYPFLTFLYKSNSELPVNISGYCDKNEARAKLKEMYKNLAMLQENKTNALKNICDFMYILDSKLINNVSEINRHNLKANFLKIFTEIYMRGTSQLQSTLTNYIPNLISYFKNLDFILKLLLRMTTIQGIAQDVMEILPKLVCAMCSKYVHILTWHSDSRICFTIQCICIECEFPNITDQKQIKKLLLESKNQETPIFISDISETKPQNIHLNEMFKITWNFIQNYSITINSVKLLLSLSKHLPMFHTIEVTKYWIKLADHTDKCIRQEFSKSFCNILKSLQENRLTENGLKEEILKFCIEELFKLSKKSLQYSDYDLQYSLLETIYGITELKLKPLHLETMKILLYFIMIPTSKYAGIAENHFLELANKQGTKPLMLYGRYRREICQCIVELCAVNQALVQYKMSKSLENVSLVLGFLSSRDFVCKESNYLMPYLVSFIVIMPDVLNLVIEVATLTEVDQGELLASNYGNIFLYLFLNKSDREFKDCMRYIESKTGFSSSVLRKRNFKTILNELLLNFHEKRDRVLIALKLLAKEDTDGETILVEDYLQPRFLGVLQYFDTKLFAKKQVLLSLAEIFKFMGPKRIAAFRFKIIAMLRTALNLNYGTYPELNCNVWEAFVKNCDIESLGGQLALIFVSLLPLSEIYPAKINSIFSYLILQNENLLSDYIIDLFFVLDYNVATEIHHTIKKHLKEFENKNFKDKLRYFMKYLTHETNEVKVHALRFLKRMIQENRIELDQMVLGYNGMEPCIVELLEILTVSSLEKDKSLKLACGECIGELGAIEPSHLPRKYTEAQSFTFFITEDNFIISSLNELLRALQAEKNTTIMDRFALAIQETLKVYGISPNTNAPKHIIWNCFSQAHKELMVLLLSSRYKMGQPLEPVNISPIYGSNMGTNFQTWAHNWTCVLISNIKTDKRSILEICLPSMKQNHRTLMQFLPHILLHSLLEGSTSHLNKCYDEFTAIINSFNRHRAIDSDLLYTRPLHTSNFNAGSAVLENSMQRQCTKMIFVLLDFLERWIREWEWQRGAAGREDENYKKICIFVSKFCKLKLAECSFQCGEYSRTLMYLEDYITNNREELDRHLFFFAKIYAQLDEPDVVAGITTFQNKEPTLEQRILALEVSGKLSDAIACYERVPPPLKLRHLQGLIRCYLDLDNVNTALNFTEGAIEKQPEYARYLFELQAEPLWRLGKYDDLSKLLEKREVINNNTWGIKIGQALLQIQKGQRDAFKDTLKKLRIQQVDLLGATSLEEGAYQHGYESVVRLHAVNELEDIERVIQEVLVKPNDHKSAELILKKLSTEWNLRIKVVQESIKIIEPILCLRRVALNQAKKIIQDRVPSVLPFINSLLGESWLLSVKAARRAGIHQQAYTYTLKAEEYLPPKLFLEKAKLHWLREEHEQALSTLTRGVEILLPTLSSDVGSEKRKMCAKAKLLIATYNDKISNVDTDVNIMHYKEALEMNKEWEKSYVNIIVSLAQYYDRIFQTYTGDDRDEKCSDIQIHMINYFGKSMLYGTNYVYQSMPRMLSIWFDYGTRLLEVNLSTVKDERKQNLLRMTKLIDNFLERLPSYIFLTAFSQIVSRICHPQKEVYIELKSIIIKLILQYPQQTMWMMISVIKSSYLIRSKRCAEILGDSKLKGPSMVKLVTDFTKLGEKLIELCNKEIPENITTININTLFRNLPRLLSKSDFSEIMIPTQKFRKLVLPNPDFRSTQHNPFPNHYVHIIGIEDEVTILQSLQRPRKITFRGSDGKGYIQMLKPKDDLRKDFRLMEFNDIVNQMLSRDSDSRQRRLNIRLYSVAPLNEECGLIEWIPNLVGLRPILMTIYKQRGQGMRGRELKEVACNLRDPLSKKREIFEKKLLSKHPPVLGEWFRKTFPDVQGWLMARTAYTRTTAVISMVGYILGLGDRHGENILLDSISGDTVHVDFNCLFNKGETFEWPERVPFRLTHNMVSAMGPLGVEGVFRKSSACTLKVLRAHTDILMSIVTPFVYDPLVSWPRNSVVTVNAQNAERTNEQAVEHVRNIKSRLQGMIRTRGRSFSIALSVDGQINNIIEEAMNIDNLCQMYIGWGAYL